MIDLDVRSVTAVATVNYLLCSVFIVVLLRRNRDRFGGMNLLAGNFVVQPVALGLIMLRGAIPDWISIVLANTLLMVGVLMIYMGLERFLYKARPQLHNYFLLVLGSFALWIFYAVHPDLPKRGMVVAGFVLVICAQCLWLLWRRVTPALPWRFGIGMILVGYCLLSIIRIADYFVADVRGPDDFFQASGFQPGVLMSYQAMILLLTFSLMQMVNRRLLLENKAQQEKFRSIVELAPYAIMLTRLSDGIIVDVNREFETGTNFSRTEVVGKSLTDFHPWESAEGRATIMADLARDGKLTGREINFRTKSGEVRVGLLSAKTIDMDGEPYALGFIADITASRQTARQLAASRASHEAEMSAALETQHQARLAAMNLMEDALAAKRHADETVTQLHESELRWKFAIEGSGDGLWDWNVAQSTVFFSERWKSMLGFAPDEIGSGLDEWSKRVHPEDLARVMADVQAHLDGTTPQYINEHRVSCKDGSWKWILARGLAVVRDADGKALRMIGTHSDTTERKRAEQKLTAQLDELRRWQEAMFGREGRVMEIKQEVNRLLAAQGQPPRYPSALDEEPKQ